MVFLVVVPAVVLVGVAEVVGRLKSLKSIKPACRYAGLSSVLLARLYLITKVRFFTKLEYYIQYLLNFFIIQYSFNIFFLPTPNPHPFALKPAFNVFCANFS